MNLKRGSLIDLSKDWRTKELVANLQQLQKNKENIRR